VELNQWKREYRRPSGGRPVQSKLGKSRSCWAGAVGKVDL